MTFDLGDFTLRNAVLGAALLGVSSGLLSSFTLLRRQSLLGDALSHAALPGICLGFLLVGTRQLLPLLTGALLSGALAALTLLLLTRHSRLKEDTGLGVVLSLFFALGLVLLTFIQGRRGAGQAGLETFLFGQAAAVLPGDLWLIGGVSLGVLLLLVLGFKELKLTTFDPGYARSIGLPVAAIDLGLTLLIALAVVLGLQFVGVVLMSAMIVAPGAAARQWSRSLEQMTLLATLFATLSGFLGAFISAQQRGLATGPVIVLLVSAIVLVSLLVAPERGLVWAALRLQRERTRLRHQRVLLDLYRLAGNHGDPRYPSETGMVGALYGYSPTRQLRALEQQGFLTSTAHVRGEGTHYVLTDAGLEQARILLAHITPNHPDARPHEVKKREAKTLETREHEAKPDIKASQVEERAR